ncbi:MAG TPA: carboxypeptidase regulatory-like domain-containing protein [Candidatus Angelobacter sp.]
MRSRALLSALVIGLLGKAAFSQAPLRKIGELDLQIQGISATVQPANPTIPKNTPAGVQIVVTTASGTLSSAAVAQFLGGTITVTGELSGPGLSGAISLPAPASSGGTPIVDPLILPIPALTQPGNYTLSGLKILVNGVAALDVTPSTVPITVIDQVLITSVQTRPLTLDEIQAAGVVLDSSDFTGFQFTIGLALQSNAVTISFPVVFDRNGVPVPQPLVPPLPPMLQSVPIPTIVPVMLNVFSSDGQQLLPQDIKTPDGQVVGLKIPGVLVIPGNVGFLKQFFSAQLLVANGAPGGSGLVVHDVTSTIVLPPGADGVVGTSDDPLSLPTLQSGPEPATMPVKGVGPDGQPGTADDVNALNPGDQGEADYTIRGDQEGFHTMSFNIQGTLDGLVTGPVTISGVAQGGVLVRNPFFDMTFAVPAIVRNGEPFKVFVTVKNISQTTANLVTLSLDKGQLSGATLQGDPTQTMPTLAAGASQTLTYSFISQRTGEVVATYLHFDTTDGTTGQLNFTLGVDPRGVPLSPDTLVLPASVDNLPESVVDAAMRVLGEGWSIANAPAGTLPASVIRTNKSVVTQKALALAEAGLRVQLGESLKAALRDLLDDFYGGQPLDPGFDQLLRTTDAGQDFERAVGAALAQPAAADGILNFQGTLSNVFASGPDFISFALTSGSSAPPVTFSLTDGNGNVSQNLSSTAHFSNAVPGFAQAPLGNVDASPSLGLLTAPSSFPYTLRLTGTGAGTVDLAVTMPHADGRFIRGTISGAAVSAGLQSRVVMDLSQPDRLVLEQDTAGDGTFATQLPLSTSIIAASGPTFLTASVIDGATLQGASPMGVHMALLFDRPVDSTTAQQVSNYQVPSNVILQAKPQLSGRIVIANLQQPEGPYVPTSVTVGGIADARGVIGSTGNQPVQSLLSNAGAVVSGHIINADGTPVAGAIVTYSAFDPGDDCAGQGPPSPVSQITVDAQGRYQIRYVVLDPCGRPFTISTQDPNTGALRQVNNFVRFGGEQLIVDIALFGRGNVAGTVRDLNGNPMSGAKVLVSSDTDIATFGVQVTGQAVTDGNGQYSVSGITVGPVTVQAGKGNGLGHSAGNIPRAGDTATVDVTLDSGAVSVSGTLAKTVNNGPVTPVPNWPVVYGLGPHTVGPPSTPLVVVNTDSAGNFTFTGVPEGNFEVFAQLTATDSGLASNFAIAGQTLTNQNITVAINTQSLGTVNGTVFFPDNSPAAGVIVNGPGGGVLSNPNGTYSLTGIPISTTNQTIQAFTRDGLQNGSAKVLVNQPGQVVNGINITLSGLGTAQFTVLDANGNPVVGQAVAITNGCSSACGCNPVTTTVSNGTVTVSSNPVLTDVHGNAVFTNMPVGSIGAKAVSSALDVADGSASIPANGATGFATLRFKGNGTVIGTVVDPDGKPSFGANLALTANIFDSVACEVIPGPAQQVQTDLTGSFKFNGVKAGPVSVTASQVFFPVQVGAQGNLSANQTLNFNLQLINTTAGVFSGTVFLPDGVTPAGAGVTVTANGPLPDVTVSTDASGNFKFAKIFPQGSYTVTVSDPVSGGVVRDTVFLPAGQPPNPAPDVTHNFRLKGKGTVTVQVVDGSNNAVNNAFVKLTENTFPNNEQEGAIQPANQGTVTFQQVFEGPFSVVVSDNVGRGGRASSVLPGPDATVNVVVQLTSTGTVQGSFVMPDNTTPIPFASVSLVAGGRQIGQETTDTSGSFTFTFVPAGPVLVQAQDPATGRVGVAAGTISTDGQTITLNVTAQSLGTVKGLVTSDGVPQAGASVDIFSGSYHAATVSDPTGMYTVSGVPAGHIVVNASLANGFLLGTNSGTLAGEGTQLEVDVALRGSGGIQGTVVQSDGHTPAPGSLVTATVGGQGGGTESVTTDSNGNFAFPVVPEGIATLNAALLGSIDQGSAAVDVAAGSTASVQIPLNGVGSITGHTRNGASQPIAGHLTITGTGPFPYTFVVDTNSDGAFSLPQVLAGTFTARLTVASNNLTLSGTAFSSVQPNANTDIDVLLQSTGSVTGTVYRSDQTTPAAGANVTVALASGSIVVQAQTDGTFEADGVPLGNFTVRINDPVSTGQALVTGQSLTTEGQTVSLGTIFLNDTPMSVISITPADGATGQSITQPIVITFSNPLQSVAGIQFATTSGSLSLTNSLSPDGRMATFTGTLPDSAKITVTVTTSVSDIFGRNPILPTTATFQTKDLTPPHVISVAPLSGQGQVPANATVIVTFSEPLDPASDLSVLITLTSSAGPIAGTTALTAPAQATFTPAAPLPANTTFTVTVNGETDPSGNKQTVAFTSTFASVDTIPPVVQLVSPASGSFVTTGRPGISFSATDALSGVDFTTAKLNLDGQQVATGTLSFTPPTSLSEGPHTVSASVADRVGNVGTASGSFTVDTQPPSAAQVSGVTNGQVVQGIVALTLSATDATSGVASIQLLVDGNPNVTVTPPFTVNFNTATLSEGIHQLAAQAVDAAGNRGVVGPAVSIEVNNIQATVAITSPQNGADFRNSVTVTAVTNQAVQNVQFTLGQQSFTVTASPYSATFDLTALPDSRQTITATANGFGDAPATASVTIHVKHNPPLPPDSAKILAQKGVSLVQVTGFPGAALGAVSVQITNLANSATVSPVVAADGSFTATLAGSLGDTLALTSTDDVGNVSAVTNVTVATSSASAAEPPRPLGSVVDPGNPLAASLAGLYLMNEGTGTTDINLVDSQPASFAGTTAPSWNVFDPSVVFGGGGTQVSYLNAGTDLIFDRLTPGPMTIVSKIFVNALSGGIAEKNNGGGSSGFVFEFDSTGALRLRVSRSSSAMLVATAGVVPTGQWVQVAATWDGTVGTASAAHLYLNGVEQTKATAVDGSGTVDFSGASNQPLRIGTVSVDLSASLNGRMAYLAIYKGRVLSAAEISELDQQLPIKHLAGAVGLIAPGTSESVSSSTAGQTLSLGFNGTAGQPASISFSNNTMGTVTVAVVNPDQTTLVSTTSSSASFSLPVQVLPQTGSYLISITSGTAGSITVSLALGVVPSRTTGATLDASNPLAASLAGLYLMNEGSGSADINLVDSQPASFAGSIPPVWNTLDPSLVFGGGGSQVSYLNAGTDLSFDQLTPGPMTIVSKIFVNALSGGIAEKNNGGGSSGFVFEFDSTGALRLRVSRSSAAMLAATAGVVPTGQWVQVAATWDGTAGTAATAATAHLYLNGVEQTKATAVDGSGTVDFSGASNQPLRIGTVSVDLSASLNGRMAYLAIYKGRVLSATEISELDQQLPIKQPNLPLVVSFSAPPQGTGVNGQVTVSAAVTKEVQRVDFTLGSQTISAVQPPFQATFDLTSVAEGAQTITATGFGFDATSVSAQLNIVVDHTLPAAPDPTKVFAEPPIGGVSRVHGLAGSVAPSISVEVTDLTSGLRAITVAAADGSFSVDVLALQGDTVSIVAIDEAENRSPATIITVLAVASPFARIVIPDLGVAPAKFTWARLDRFSSGTPLLPGSASISPAGELEPDVLVAAHGHGSRKAVLRAISRNRRLGPESRGEEPQQSSSQTKLQKSRS